MEEGLLSLKWNNHKTTFFEILKGLRDKANYTDATLAVEGKFYPVHKLVLSTCSEYFSEIFDRTPCKSPVIVLKDVRYQDLESLLDYMYLGEVNVNQNDLALLLKTAECLRIKGLAVPDDDPTRHSVSPNSCKETRSADWKDASTETPPAKRRKGDSHIPSSPSRVPPTTNIPSSPGHPLTKSSKGSTEKNAVETNIDPASVKVEISEITDLQETLPGDDGEKFLIDKTDHESDFQNSHYSSSVPTGEVQWEDGENHFQDSYIDDCSGHHTVGKDEEEEQEDEEGEEVDVTSVWSNNQFSSMSLTQTKESRRCQLCQVTLANANLLRRHVEDHHFHIRKYDCVHCGKKFKRKEHKERHERIHTGEKPFGCHICLSRFTQKEHLKGHIENVHNKHLRDREKESFEYIETEPEGSESSPPSLASPSSLSSLMSSSMATVFPSSLSFGQMLPSITSPSSILPTTLSDDRSVMALYAPVTRKSVTSPNKHVQTITINFN